MANEDIPQGPTKTLPEKTESEKSLQAMLEGLTDEQKQKLAKAGEAGPVAMMIELIKQKLSGSGISAQEIDAAVPPALRPVAQTTEKAVTKS
ncbi:MAG: hypothetical protein EBV03_07780 [Proteobacteria bacterium]|nr:hypothetical protein [Pseudomonadota bacterium]